MNVFLFSNLKKQHEVDSLRKVVFLQFCMCKFQHSIRKKKLKRGSEALVNG